MSILEGAYWISCREPRKSLRADADGSVWGVDPGPRGIDILDSTALRSQIWLAEKATDGQSFRFRNYETGSLLDGNYQNGVDMPRVVATRRCTDGQLWEVAPLKDFTSGPMYQIKNVATSIALDLSETTGPGGHCRITLNRSESEPHEGWLIEPVILPTLYSITNISHQLVLYALDHPNPSDGISGGIKLVPPEQPTRNRLWMLEYVSPDEAIVRSASSNRFVLDLASDSQTVLVCEYHGGSSQRWRIKYDGDETLSLVNTKTGTLLAIKQRDVSKYRRLNRLVAAPDGATQWGTQSCPQPPLFWVTIQDPSGAHIAQVNDEPLMLYEVPLNINDHTTQWRFIMTGDGLEYVIENRATGFMFGANAIVDRNDASVHWRLSSSESGSFQLINTASKNLVFRGTAATITTQPAGYQAYDNTPNGDIPCQICDWYLKPAYDNLPSFAIVNSYTGRCITNNPTADIGTVSTTSNINDFRSQWHFHAQSADEAVDDLICLLSNKMSENSLEVGLKEEIRVEAYNDNRQSSIMDPNSVWRLLPLSVDLLALSMHFGPGFLYDPGSSNSQTQEAPKDIQALYWYLVSHRQSGFDLVSLAYSTTEQVLEYMASEPSETPWDAIQRYCYTDRGPTNGPGSVLKCIPVAGSVSPTVDATIRAAFALLIAQWVEDSIPKTTTPHTIISATWDEVEKQWGVCVGEHALRRSSDQQVRIRIDLQGVYDVGGTWVAGIQGQWVDTTMFLVVIPVEMQVGYAVVQRAMLQSLNQGLAVQVRTVRPSPAGAPLSDTRPDFIRPHGSYSFVRPPIQPIQPTEPTKLIQPIKPTEPESPYHYDSDGYSDYDDDENVISAYNNDLRTYYTNLAAYHRDIAAYNRDLPTYNRDLATYNNDIAAYRIDLPTYTSNLAVYNSDRYWKLRSAEMRFINQPIS